MHHPHHQKERDCLEYLAFVAIFIFFLFIIVENINLTIQRVESWGKVLPWYETDCSAIAPG